MMKFTQLIVLAGATALIGSPVLAQQQPSTTSNSTSNSNSSPARLSNADRKYLVDTASGSTHEFEVAQLGVEKATSPAARQYAQQLLKDHATLNNRLLQLAHQERVTIPVQPESGRQKIAQLKQLSGSAFDQAFAQEMVRINREDISKAQQELKTTQNPNIQAFLNQLLSTDRQHLQAAQSIAQNRAQNSMSNQSR